MGLIPLEKAGKRHKPGTFEIFHPRGEGAVVFTHKTPWVRLGVNSEGLPSGGMGGKMSYSAQKKQRNERWPFGPNFRSLEY